MADWGDKFDARIAAILWGCICGVVVAGAVAVIIHIVRWACG